MFERFLVAFYDPEKMVRKSASPFYQAVFAIVAERPGYIRNRAGKISRLGSKALLKP